MAGLVAVLWLLYLSECFVRWRPGDWIFRPSLSGVCRGVSEPDLTLLAGRYCFVWTSLLPGNLVHRFSGDDTNRRRSQVRLQGVRARTLWLRLSSSTLFALVMVGLPALLWTERFVPWLPVFGTIVITVWAATLASFVVAHRRLYRRSPPMDSWLLVALSPVSLMRAPMLVALEASCDTHPALAADALCEPDEFLRIARLWHFDVPELRPRLQGLAARRGREDQLSAPPVDTEPGVTSFCRRCHATYQAAATRCVDCDAVELTPLPGPVSRREHQRAP